MQSSDSCFCCGGTSFNLQDYGYAKCQVCGVEVRKAIRQTFMENEALIENRIKRKDLKDRFQIALTIESSSEKKNLLDIGCGPGRFLNHIRDEFEIVAGVEITPNCIEFAREKFNLRVTNSIPIDIQPSVITMWHSLEHFPSEKIRPMLNQISKLATSKTALIISVPNISSLHWKLFGTRSVYFDYENHTIQFTTESLSTLMKNFEFKLMVMKTGIAYSLIGNALSFVNLMTGTSNWLYLKLRRSNSTWSLADLPRLLLHLGLLAISLLISVPLFIFELAVPGRGAVLTAVFRVKK